MKIIIKISLLSLAIVLGGCQHATKKADNTATQLTIISINDVYRIDGINQGKTGGLARVRALRKQLQAENTHVLLLHAGDFLHPSFNSKQDDGVAMITTLNYLDGAADVFDEDMIVTFGNHEFDKGKLKHVPILNQLLAASEFTWLDSNIEWTQDSIQSDKLAPYIIKSYGDYQVGVFSVTIDNAHPEYIANFTDFKTTAARIVPQLKAAGADFIIALTHQTITDDMAMLDLPEAIRPDIIFGGHEHFEQVESVNNRWVLKADADAVSAVVVQVDLNNLEQALLPQIVPLGVNIDPDPDSLKLITRLNSDIETAYCQKHQLEERCLQNVLGATHTELIAEETAIRRFETNLGNLLADLAKAEFETCQADIAIINSGSIRLNQNIAAGDPITAKHLHEMFPYPSDLRLIEIPSTLLPEILQHSISNWTANGHWLQVSGLSFLHDPDDETVQYIHIDQDEEVFNPKPNDLLRLVVPFYLLSANTDQDGYTFFNESMIQNCSSNGAELNKLFTDYLRINPEGIAPIRDYRICNTLKDHCFN